MLVKGILPLRLMHSTEWCVSLNLIIRAHILFRSVRTRTDISAGYSNSLIQVQQSHHQKHANGLGFCTLMIVQMSLTLWKCDWIREDWAMMDVFKEGSSRCSEYQLKSSKKCQPRVVSFAFAQLQRQEYSTKTFFLKNRIKSKTLIHPFLSIPEPLRTVAKIKFDPGFF